MPKKGGPGSRKSVRVEEKAALEAEQAAAVVDAQTAAKEAQPAADAAAEELAAYRAEVASAAEAAEQKAAAELVVNLAAGEMHWGWACMVVLVMMVCGQTLRVCSPKAAAFCGLVLVFGSKLVSCDAAGLPFGMVSEPRRRLKPTLAGSFVECFGCENAFSGFGRVSRAVPASLDNMNALCLAHGLAETRYAASWAGLSADMKPADLELVPSNRSLFPLRFGGVHAALATRLA